MGDAAGQLPDGLHFLGMAILFLHSGPFGLRLQSSDFGGGPRRETPQERQSRRVFLHGAVIQNGHDPQQVTIDVPKWRPQETFHFQAVQR